MTKNYLYGIACILLCTTNLYAQQDSAIQTIPARDTAITKELRAVVIHAYGQNGKLLETPAAVHVTDKTDLDQYNNTSILPAINKTPGVRMEERSPGSYRFGIRGSAVESPFGVRNVKVYYNDIPYTDPGGNTYLNQLGFYNINAVEIIKGPGSSLYGAGTGGVLLITSMPQQWQTGLSLNYTGGSYNLSSMGVEARIGDSSFHNVIRYQHLSSDGYRQQSASRKDVWSWDAVRASGKSEISTHFLYGDLYYQTPGALNRQQYDADPQQARPGLGATPGAVQSNAAIYQKTFLAGFTYKQAIGAYWSNSTTLYGLYSQQANPNLRNYSLTSEPNFGGRTQFKFERETAIGKLQWISGAEAQQSFTQNKTYLNVNSKPQSLQTDQGIDNRQLMGFSQLQLQYNSWVFSAGLGISQLNVVLNTASSATYAEEDKTFNNQLAPRLAALRRLSEKTSIYATVAKGFSPPTTAELAPTGSMVNFNLEAEQAWNYEIGVRSFIGERLYVDAGIYYFELQQAIVQRRDSAAGDYYVNAGATKQAGLEVYTAYKILKNRSGFISACNVYASYTANSYHYDRFIQDGIDYSGKRMPGSAANTIATGINLQTSNGLYLNLNYFYSDRIAMNDANTAYANAYNLLGTKLGYAKSYKRYSINIFAGADNMLNERYSLGNDINAVNGKYYNAAAPANYYAGLSLGYSK